jgi:hypothetical protein
MNSIFRQFAAPIAIVAMAAPAPAFAQRLGHELVRYGNVQIDVTTQGKGPVIVMLPSLGRSGRDYDKVAARLQKSGFRPRRGSGR